MVGNAQISFVGNLGGDPELRFTPSGAAVVNFSVAVVDRRKNQEGGWEDGETTWYRCNAWRQLAENIAESLAKGTRVVVLGTIKSRAYENRESGAKGVSWEVEVDAIGPELRFATAKSQRADRQQGGGGYDQGGWNQGGRGQQGGGQYGGRPQGGGGRGAAPSDDPWGQPPRGGGGYGGGGFVDEPPF